MDSAAPNAPAVGVTQPSKLRAVVLALLINAVPLAGVLYFEWSAINVLVLYWFENLLIGLCTLIRLLMHRRWTRKRGYWRRSNRLGIRINDKPAEMGLIGEYAAGTFGFTLAHGVFVAGIAALVHQNYPDQAMWQLSWDQVLRGALAIAAFLGVELIVDLTRIRGATFAALRDYAQARMSRIVVLHLAIIFGMFAMAMTDSPLGILYVLLGLKALAEVGSVFGQGAVQKSESEPPPAWALKMVDKLGKDKGGSAAFLKDWEREQETNRRNAIEDEEVVSAQGR